MVFPLCRGLHELGKGSCLLKKPDFPLCTLKPWPSSTELQQEPERSLPSAEKYGKIKVSIKDAGSQK